MKLLITGGTGFLGSHLARHLVEKGHDVCVLARRSSATTRLHGYERRLDLLVFDSLEGARELVSRTRPDCIIHTACNYGRAGEAAAEIAGTNLMFPLVLLEAATSNGTGSFINTDTSLDKYLNPYTLSKKQFAEWGEWFAGRQRIQFINVLLEHMFGPGDNTSKFTTHVIRSCIQDVQGLELTPGEQQRDFIYIDDVVSAYSTILDNLHSLQYFENLPLGSGHAVSIRQFVETVCRLAGSRTQPEFGALPYRENEAMFCQADTTRLHALGWVEEYDLAAGIKRTIELEKSA
jgi:nucleoside-diphosphate-sugar epimerase